MSDIAELERRIIAALDRIGTGLEGLAAPEPAPPEPEPEPLPAVDPAELERLREALGAEKEANAQLEERVKELRRRLDDAEADREAALDEMRAQLQAVQGRVQKLRRTNQQLNQTTQELREAAASGVSDPELVNRALQAELDGLRAAREADRGEIDVILGELKPMLQEAADA